MNKWKNFSLRRSQDFSWDGWGILLSGICLVHCLLTPVMLLVLPSFVPHWLRAEGLSHQWFFVALVFIVGVASITGWLHHRSWKVVGWLMSGLIVIGIATFLLDGSAEYIVTILGSLILIRGHRLNQSKPHRHFRQGESSSSCVR